MFWTVVKKELLANLVSFRFMLIFLLCCTLIIVSAYTMRDKYEERVKEYSAAVKIHKVDFLILFLLVACFFMIAYIGFVRNDVR